ALTGLLVLAAIWGTASSADGKPRRQHHRSHHRFVPYRPVVPMHFASADIEAKGEPDNDCSGVVRLPRASVRVGLLVWEVADQTIHDHGAPAGTAARNACAAGRGLVDAIRRLPFRHSRHRISPRPGWICRVSLPHSEIACRRGAIEFHAFPSGIV